MWTFTVLFDARPPFVRGSRGGSLLLAPLGDGTVLSELRTRLGTISKVPPVIVAGFDFDAGYEKAIREACPDAERVETALSFAERCHSYEPSDRLLFADPTCFPLDPEDPAFVTLGAEEDPRWIKHAVALDRGNQGTKEYVDADRDGRVRGIQRYYDAVTWPFATGVACSLVPVAGLRIVRGLPAGSLAELRRALVAAGIPSRDIPLERGAVSLESERGLLALNERVVLDLARRAGGAGASNVLPAGRDTRVHPNARIVGPVVLQDGAEIEDGATVIGPSVIGAGGRVGAHATVAQSVIGRGLAVGPGTTLRHRALLDNPSDFFLPAPEPEEPFELGELESWEAAPYEVEAEQPRRGFYPFIKRAIDIAAAATGLTLLAPIGLPIAVLIKLESKGPIHFGHLREGMGGRPFRCWKFRTMIPNADVLQRKLAETNQMDGPQFKLKRDPRRTRVGAIMTALNLDEIPQLWNVLVGDMSLVGPRPSPFRENQVCVPWREARLSVRPGITGLWQVCRHDREKSDFHQWIYYDLLYVQNLSFLLDLKLIAATFVTMAKSGAVPLSWLLKPETYGERRTTPRGRESAPGLQDRRTA